MDFSNFVLNPVTLLAVVFGIVEFIKSLGVTGNTLRWVSLGVGVILAIVFQTTTLFPAISPYIETIFFGIAVGLAASGIFSFINNRIPTKKEE
jgi:ABC-type uncharacterized transport system permease subunit